MENFFKKYLDINNKILKNINTSKIELSEEDVHPEDMILKLRAIAHSHGGELLSIVFILITIPK